VADPLIPPTGDSAGRSANESSVSGVAGNWQLVELAAKPISASWLEERITAALAGAEHAKSR
jgi:uncharacterized protein HemY